MLDQILILGMYTNSADPVQVPQNAASGQGLDYLLPAISIQNAIKTSTRNPKNYKWTHPNDKNGQVYSQKRNNLLSEIKKCYKFKYHFFFHGNGYTYR